MPSDFDISRGHLERLFQLFDKESKGFLTLDQFRNGIRKFVRAAFTPGTISLNSFLP